MKYPRYPRKQKGSNIFNCLTFINFDLALFLLEVLQLSYGKKGKIRELRQQIQT